MNKSFSRIFYYSQYTFLEKPKYVSPLLRNKGQFSRVYSSLKEQKNSYLIETNELYDLIKSKKKYLLFDVSWYNIKNDNEYTNDDDNLEKIESSINFNSNIISNQDSNISSFSFPTQSEFFSYLRELLIKHEIVININSLENIPFIFYEKDDIFYSPRIWFIFKIFGFNNVKILNGGLNKWISEGKYVISQNETEYNHNNITSDKERIKHVDQMIEEHLIRNKESIKTNLKKYIYNYSDIENYIAQKKNNKLKTTILIDTRPNASFSSLLLINNKKTKINNHIPFSINIPYHYFINSNQELYKYFTFKSKLELRNICNAYGILNEQNVIIATCNKGITACILIYILCLLNIPFSNLILYHGSFSEYKYYKYNIS
ncbi:rhodanese like protein, putative [Plasmodium yoelii]|uniref:Thiosulfate sulfurtransferase n=2 Tax=Plasmodium yoelii TaxID=5861 RepID=A0AAE9WT14_PLAYO|nr:rhodanese like protein, putative [Plasmodium yoelii]WBY55943.1 thiosulfate sulfurtransferase [Plasmodium yoelii yoelii]CDU16929.1 rhodanese like protein, putative [Plasmodium yoelii]VTZ75232.1 rhodanese like protein, putative [Plasmodium yoelii]|eukprot:XP_729672.2 rhodanese like protein, putative [Plasmodium yoelii]